MLKKVSWGRSTGLWRRSPYSPPPLKSKPSFGGTWTLEGRFSWGGKSYQECNYKFIKIQVPALEEGTHQVRVPEAPAPSASWEIHHIHVLAKPGSLHTVSLLPSVALHKVFLCPEHPFPQHVYLAGSTHPPSCFKGHPLCEALPKASVKLRRWSVSAPSLNLVHASPEALGLWFNFGWFVCLAWLPLYCVSVRMGWIMLQ